MNLGTDGAGSGDNSALVKVTWVMPPNFSSHYLHRLEIESRAMSWRLKTIGDLEGFTRHLRHRWRRLPRRKCQPGGYRIDG
jgi:hypothetical protein